VKYAVEMGSGSVTCTSSITKIGSGIQKFCKGKYRYTESKVSSFFFN
jgi:hypothetical protein